MNSYLMKKFLKEKLLKAQDKKNHFRAVYDELLVKRKRTKKIGFSDVIATVVILPN